MVLINNQRETRKACHFHGLFPHLLARAHFTHKDLGLSGERRGLPRLTVKQVSKSQNSNPALLTPSPLPSLTAPRQQDAHISNRPWRVGGQGGAHNWRQAYSLECVTPKRRLMLHLHVTYRSQVQLLAHSEH